jgi:hypothetical protein
MKIYCFVFLLLSALLATMGCSRKTQENQSQNPGNPKLESAHGSVNATPAASNEGLTFTPPSGWIAETPSSSIRKAQFKLPHAEGDAEDAELVVYYFSGGGGTPQANIDRWVGEFTKPDGSPAADAAKITHRTIDGIPFTIVDVIGNYANSMISMKQSNAPKANYRLLGAIAETKTGPWFIKLTGHAKTVSKWAPGYDAFLNSMKYK